MTGSPDITAADRKLLAIAAETLDVPGEALTLDTGARDIGAWDSLGHVTLVEAVELAFDVSFPAAEIVAFETLRDISDALARRDAIE